MLKTVILWLIKKYIFALYLHIWHRAPNTLGISQGMRTISVFCYVNKMTSELHLRMVAGCQENNHVKPTEISKPLNWGGWWDGGELLEDESITSGHWFNQPCLCNAAFIKIWKDRFWSVFGWWTCEGTGKMVCLRGHGSAMHFPHPLIYISLPSGCSVLYPFMINCWSSK